MSATPPRRLRACPGGPLLVDGDVELTDEDGTVHRSTRPVTAGVPVRRLRPCAVVRRQATSSSPPAGSERSPAGGGPGATGIMDTMRSESGCGSPT